MTYKERGFTLLELIVVTFISAILLSIAAPSFKSFLNSHKTESAANTLLTSIALARSEAIKRNASVTMKSITGTWIGWEVEDTSGTDIQVFDAPANEVSFEVVNIGTSMIFLPTGELSSPSGNFTICSIGSTSGYKIHINAVGRPRKEMIHTCSL